MKKIPALVVIAISLLAASACASDLPQNFDPRGVITVLGREGIAHACPVSADIALTAEHVSTTHHPFSRPIVYPQIWADGLGNSGTAMEVWADLRRDLSAIKVFESDEIKTPPYQMWYSLAPRAPAVGDVVWIVGYNFQKGLTPLPISAKILNVMGGHITYDNSPGPGSSGSCVFLGTTGEVVAINVALIGGDIFRKPVGIGVSVWGEWGQVPKIFQEANDSH